MLNGLIGSKKEGKGLSTVHLSWLGSSPASLRLAFWLIASNSFNSPFFFLPCGFSSCTSPWIPSPSDNLLLNSQLRSALYQIFFSSRMVAQWKRICLRCRRPGFNPWVGKIPWKMEWQATPVSCLGNPMDRGAWQAIAHGIAKGWT